jgi:hypothetical protein
LSVTFFTFFVTSRNGNWYPHFPLIPNPFWSTNSQSGEYVFSNSCFRRFFFFLSSRSDYRQKLKLTNVAWQSTPYLILQAPYLIPYPIPGQHDIWAWQHSTATVTHTLYSHVKMLPTLLGYGTNKMDLNKIFWQEIFLTRQWFPVLSLNLKVLSDRLVTFVPKTGLGVGKNRF